MVIRPLVGRKGGNCRISCRAGCSQHPAYTGRETTRQEPRAQRLAYIVSRGSFSFLFSSVHIRKPHSKHGRQCCLLSSDNPWYTLTTCMFPTPFPSRRAATNPFPFSILFRLLPHAFLPTPPTPFISSRPQVSFLLSLYVALDTSYVYTHSFPPDCS